MRVQIAALLIVAAALAGCAGGGGGDNGGIPGGNASGDGPTPTTVTNHVTGSPPKAPNPFGKPKPANATPTNATPTPTPTPTPATTDGADGAAADASVAIADFRFSPADLEVAVGDLVAWTNQDGARHTVTADDGSFDSGSLAQGESFSHAFDAPGSYPYHCALHPGMTGTVTVA